MARGAFICSASLSICPLNCWACFNSEPILASSLNMIVSLELQVQRRTAARPAGPGVVDRLRGAAAGAGGGGPARPPRPPAPLEGKLHVYRLAYHFTEGLLKAGDLIGPLTIRLRHLVKRLEHHDQLGRPGLQVT